MLIKALFDINNIQRRTVYFLKGFTLAEVLITLGIIGVVAAMTLPVLTSKYQEQVIVSQLKKSYSILSQATTMAQSDFGQVSEWNIKDNDMNSTNLAFSYIKPYIKIIKECSNKAGCWTPGYTRSLSGQIADQSGKGYIGNKYFAFTMVDGVNVSLDIFRNDNYLVNLGVNSTKDYDAGLVFVVDVNGDTSPNALGHDIFYFIQTKQGLVPAGANAKKELCSLSYNSNRSGETCAAIVLSSGKRDYLRKK